MKYLLLLKRDPERTEADPLAGSLLAFAALIANSREVDARGEHRSVAYLYELQVEEPYRCLGLGSILFNEVLAIAKSEPSRPKLVMLTCFTANGRAAKFYRDRHGFIVDEISPSPDQSDYIILSKALY